jgi:hypothetical protein
MKMWNLRASRQVGEDGGTARMLAEGPETREYQRKFPERTPGWASGYRE